jgi:hypothetical protein
MSITTANRRPCHCCHPQDRSCIKRGGALNSYRTRSPCCCFARFATVRPHVVVHVLLPSALLLLRPSTPLFLQTTSRSLDPTPLDPACYSVTTWVTSVMWAKLRLLSRLVNRVASSVQILYYFVTGTTAGDRGEEFKNLEKGTIALAYSLSTFAEGRYISLARSHY